MVTKQKHRKVSKNDFFVIIRQYRLAWYTSSSLWRNEVTGSRNIFFSCIVECVDECQFFAICHRLSAKSTCCWLLQSLCKGPKWILQAELGLINSTAKEDKASVAGRASSNSAIFFYSFGFRNKWCSEELLLRAAMSQRRCQVTGRIGWLCSFTAKHIMTSFITLFKLHLIEWLSKDTIISHLKANVQLANLQKILIIIFQTWYHIS